MNEELYMRRALELAKLGSGYTAPNPMVGCVIVYDGQIIGEGWHRNYGGPHAEVNAIASVQDKSLLPESRVYVTLEPCSHFGKTESIAVANIQQTAQTIKQQLASIYPDQEAGAIAQEVLEHILQKSRVQLSLNQQQEVTITQQEKLQIIVARLQKHEPLQYVLGVAHFYGLELEVNSNVLIPRPETEELVDMVIKEHRYQQNLRILDICTGSGCIPIALAKNLNTEAVYGLEVSEGALEVAKANADKYNQTIKWLHQDIFEEVQSIKPATLDVITSNPPYVLEEEQQQMRPNVLDYEPHLALFVPDTDPLKFYQRIAAVSYTLLKPVGKLYFEINERYGQETCDVLLQVGFASASIVQDLFGKDRIVRAVR